MNCCENCFDDDYLQSFIRSKGVKGNCDYCESENVFCIEPSLLTDLFKPIIALYEVVQFGTNIMPHEDPLDHGDTLTQRIQDDWQIFSDSLFSDSRGVCSRLLSDIANAYADPREGDDIEVDDLWMMKDEGFTSVPRKDMWVEFSHHIKYERRFIIDSSAGHFGDPRDWLPEAIPKTKLKLPEGTTVYRARIGHKKEFRKPAKPLAAKDMGAPPPELTKGGRANSPGIPFLYLATNEGTAIVEVRPWEKARVSVAEFALKGNLMVADLTNIPGIQPFGVPNLWLEVQHQAVLRRLDYELARPIDPALSHIQYTPTQYLAEVIQDSGLSGIQYRSNLGSGKNLVLFNPDDARAKKVRLVEITSVAYKYQDYKEARRIRRALYEDFDD